MCNRCIFTNSVWCGSELGKVALNEDLRSVNVSLAAFKSGLLDYYTNAMNSVYDVEDPRTWKSLSIKCHTARALIVGLKCLC